MAADESGTLNLIRAHDRCLTRSRVFTRLSDHARPRSHALIFRMCGNRIGGVSGGLERGMPFPYNTLAHEIFQKSDFSPAPVLSHCDIFDRFHREDANFLLRGLAVNQ